MMGMVVLILSALCLQDPATLIEQLRSGDIAVRERAVIELEKLGATAEEQLKRVVADKDVQVAAAARRLLRIIELDRLFSPALKKAVPGIARKLATDDPKEWTRVYLDFWWKGRRHPNRTNPEVGRKDLEPLAGPALRNAGPQEYDTQWGSRFEKEDVLDAIGAWRHRSAESEIKKALRDPEGTIQYEAFHAVAALHGKRFTAHIIAVLENEPEHLVWAFKSREGLEFDAVPRLLQILKSDPDKWGEVIAEILGRMRDTRVRTEVLPLLNDSNFMTRFSALSILAKSGSRKDAAIVLPLLKDSAVRVRMAAVNAARDLGLELEPEVMTALSKDPLVQVRSGAAEWAGRRRDTRTVPALVAMCRDESKDVRLAAVKALGEIEDASCLDVVAELLKDEGEKIRGEAAKILGNLQAAGKTDAIAPLLACEDYSLRRDAARALLWLKWSPGVEKLLPLLDDEESDIVEMAIELLAQADPVRARSELVRIALQSEFAGSEAVELMWLQPDPVPLLLKSVEGKQYARDGAIEALERAQPAGIGAALRGRLKDTAGEQRAGVIMALGRLAPTEARAEFADLLKDDGEDVRIAAAGSLARLPPGPESARLQELLTDASPKVRKEAIETLRRWRVAEAVPKIRKSVEDTEFEVAAAAIKALCELDTETATRVACEWVETGKAVRREDIWERDQVTREDLAEKVLAVTGPGKELKRVVSWLEHRDSDCRRRAARLLALWNAKEFASRIVPLLLEEETRESAVDSLASMEASGTAKDLLEIVDRPESEGRAAALRAWLAVEPKVDLERLRRLARDPESEVCEIAISKLAQLQDKASVPMLTDLLKSPLGAIRQRALEALERVGEPPANGDLVDDPDWQVSQAAVSALIASKAEKTVLLDLVRDRGFHNRDWLMSALASRGAKEIIPLLKELLGDKKVRSTAINALDLLGDSAALDEYRRRTDLGPGERRELAVILAGHGEDGPTLAYLKQETDSYSRWDFCKDLCDNGHRVGVPYFLRELSVNDLILPHVLNGIRNPKAWERLGTTHFTGDGEGSVRRVVEQIGRQAGLPVRWPEGTTFEQRSWPRAMALHDYSTYDLKWILTELFVPGVDRLPGYCLGSPAFECPWDFILEEDHIRVLPRREAIAFWKQWWADEQAKKK